MTANKDEESRKKSLVPGALVFLVLVIYFNIRSEHMMTSVDWGVIAFGVLFFGFAVVRRFQDKN